MAAGYTDELTGRTTRRVSPNGRLFSGRLAGLQTGGGCSGSDCEDRPERPPDRTLCLDRGLSGPAPPRRPPAPADRRRAAHPGRGPGAARRSLRDPLAAADPRTAARRVSLPARPVRVQQAAARGAAAAAEGDPGPVRRL